MEPTEILGYFEQEWDRIRALSVHSGLNDGFYALSIPEGDLRFFDPSLPAIRSQAAGLFRAGITNPSLSNFQGLALEEQTRQNWDDEKVALVDVVYIQRGQIYSVQCLKETSTAQGTYQEFVRYVMVSPATTLEEPSAAKYLPQLRKTYMDLKTILHR